MFEPRSSRFNNNFQLKTAWEKLRPVKTTKLKNRFLLFTTADFPLRQQQLSTISKWKWTENVGSKSC